MRCHKWACLQRNEGVVLVEFEEFVPFNNNNEQSDLATRAFHDETQKPKSLLDLKNNLETVTCLAWFHWPSIYLRVFGSNVMWLRFPARQRGPLKYVSLNHWGLGSATGNDFRRWAAFHISCGALDYRYTICYLLHMSLRVNKSVRSTGRPGSMWWEKPCSHAYLNLQGLRLTADWASHHWPAQPRQWKKWLLFGIT